MFKASHKKMIAAVLLFGLAGFSRIASAKENGFKLCTAKSESEIVTVKTLQDRNPFGSEQRLTFDLEQPAYVAVCVTTPLGVVVRQLAAQALSAGEHTFCWDGSDERGADAGGGVYVYTIQTVELSAQVLALSK